MTQPTPTFVTPTWDELFMRHAYLIASKSKDARTKIGAVMVRDRHVISEGYNGLPIGVDDCCPERQERPEKYFWFEHAERNSVFVCARHGTRTEGAVMFTQGIPCAECCRAVIQAGLVEVVVHKQWQDYQYANPATSISQGKDRCIKMLGEAGVGIRVFDTLLGIKGFMDGKILDV
jgi:dCMP deaminase